MIHWLFDNEPKVIRYKCCLCAVYYNGHTQMKNHNDLKRHINIIMHRGLVQSNDKMKLIIKEYDFYCAFSWWYINYLNLFEDCLNGCTLLTFNFSISLDFSYFLVYIWVDLLFLCHLMKQHWWYNDKGKCALIFKIMCETRCQCLESLGFWKCEE